MTAIGKVFRLGPGEGTEFRIGADRFRTKGRAPERSDAFAVVEYEGAPGFPGPPPHRHRSFEEAWFVLDGEVTFLSGDASLPARAGSYLFVPRGVPHTFRVEGRRPARWLGIFSPGRYVGLVEELGSALPADGPPDEAALRRVFEKYDTELEPTSP